jgi:DNA-directed RNA polymerase subunit H (RpoH/RPB5)
MSITAETATIIHSLYNARTNLLAQLEYIGFDTTEHKSFNIHQMDAMSSQGQLDFILEDPKTSHKVYVKHHIGTNTLRTTVLNKYVEELFGNDLDETDAVLQPTDALIVLIETEPNDSLRECVSLLYGRSQIYVSVVNIARLQYNVLQHELVPTVKPVRDTSALLEELRIQNLKQLPEISRFDPMALAILLRPGEVAHITRKSPTANMTDYWRVCV